MKVEELRPGTTLLHPVATGVELLYCQVSDTPTLTEHGQVAIPVTVLATHPTGPAAGQPFTLTYAAGAEAPLCAGTRRFDVPVEIVIAGVVPVRAHTMSQAIEIAREAKPDELLEHDRVMRVVAEVALTGV